MSSIAQQRLDKWLWFARLVKTRSQASRLIQAGKVRINRTKTLKPAATVRADDVITTIINRNPKVVKVLNTGKRRGPATEAQLLYDDLTPAPLANRPLSKHKKTDKSPVPAAPAPTRDPGTGRPTKRDRRRMDKFTEQAHDRRSGQKS